MKSFYLLPCVFVLAACGNNPPPLEQTNEVAQREFHKKFPSGPYLQFEVIEMERVAVKAQEDNYFNIRYKVEAKVRYDPYTQALTESNRYYEALKLGGATPIVIKVFTGETLSFHDLKNVVKYLVSNYAGDAKPQTSGKNESSWVADVVNLGLEGKKIYDQITMLPADVRNTDFRSFVEECASPCKNFIAETEGENADLAVRYFALVQMFKKYKDQFPKKGVRKIVEEIAFQVKAS